MCYYGFGYSQVNNFRSCLLCSRSGPLWFESSGRGGGVFFIAGLVGVALVNILISLSEVKDEVVELRKEIAELKKKPEEHKSEDDKT